MKNTTITPAKFILFTSLLSVLFSSHNLQAQYGESGNTASIAIAPLFFKSFQYAPGQFDFNALPFYIEGNSSSIIGKRIGTHLYFNRQKGESLGFRNAGIEFAMPIYVYRSKDYVNLMHNAYLAPGGLVLITMKDDYVQGQVSLYIEPGYTLKIMEEFGVNLGIQIGKSYNFREFSGGNWNNYLAIKVAYLRILGE